MKKKHIKKQAINNKNNKKRRSINKKTSTLNTSSINTSSKSVLIKICPRCGSTDIRSNGLLKCNNCGYRSYVISEVRIEDIKYFRDHLIRIHEHKTKEITIELAAYLFLIIGIILTFVSINIFIPLFLILISILLFYVDNLIKI